MAEEQEPSALLEGISPTVTSPDQPTQWCQYCPDHPEEVYAQVQNGTPITPRACHVCHKPMVIETNTNPLDILDRMKRAGRI